MKPESIFSQRKTMTMQELKRFIATVVHLCNSSVQDYRRIRPITKTTYIQVRIIIIDLAQYERLPSFCFMCSTNKQLHLCYINYFIPLVIVSRKQIKVLFSLAYTVKRF